MVGYGRRIVRALAAAGPIWRPYVVDFDAVSLARKITAYRRWCQLCTARASQMNQHPIDLAGWNYQGSPAQRRAWRAVDVQREFSAVPDVFLLGAPIHED